MTTRSGAGDAPRLAVKGGVAKGLPTWLSIIAQAESSLQWKHQKLQVEKTKLAISARCTQLQLEVMCIKVVLLWVCVCVCVCVRARQKVRERRKILAQAK